MLAGIDRDEVTGLVFPDPAACRKLCPDLDADAPLETLLADARVRAAFQGALDTLAKEATGSSRRIMRILLLADPPSIDAHEVTDKGTINQSAVLTHRAELVEELYADVVSERVIAAAG